MRQGRREVPHRTVIGKPGAAFLPRSGRLNRNRSFLRLFYVDAHQEQTLRDRTGTMGGYVSESTVESRASDSEGSDTEWHSASVSVTS